MTERYSRIDSSRVPIQPRKAVKRTRGLEFLLFGILAVMVIGIGIAIYQEYSPNHNYIPSTVADGLKRDRVNILVIGIAGDRKLNGGNDLADAIMLVSLKPSTRQAALISIPRDLYVKIGHFGVHRLNAAHDLGYQMGYRGGGPGLLIDTVSEIIGQPIDAMVRVDFAAFEKVIDDLGGVDIYVYRPFYDYLFKDSFKQGWQHMNGHRALQYARYRYVQGAEGNNFARELRQQQVVSAIRKKMHNITVAQALRLLASATTASRYTTTNLSTSEIVELYRTFHDLPQGNIRHVSLAPLTEVFMVAKIDDSGEAVRPLGGSFAGVQAMARDVFNDKRPLLNRDQIQLSDADTPKPSEYTGDDTLAVAQPAKPLQR